MSNIEDLQDAIAGLEQVDCEVIHRFSDGVYSRTLIIESGVTLVGARHKTNHFLMISKGTGFFVNNDNKAEYYEAPMLLETVKGTKRAISTETKTIMTTFHPTEETDIDKIGKEILEPEPTKFLPQWKRKHLETLQ